MTDRETQTIREILSQLESEAPSCVNATVRGLGSIFGVVVPTDIFAFGAKQYDSVPFIEREMGLTVRYTAWEPGYTMATGRKPNLKAFIEDHPEGTFIVSSNAHLMLVHEGQLVDTAGFVRLGAVRVHSSKRVDLPSLEKAEWDHDRLMSKASAIRTIHVLVRDNPKGFDLETVERLADTACSARLDAELQAPVSAQAILDSTDIEAVLRVIRKARIKRTVIEAIRHRNGQEPGVYRSARSDFERMFCVERFMAFVDVVES